MEKIENSRTKKIYLILFIVWMVVVFTFSMQRGNTSSGTSTTFTKKVLEVLRITKDLDAKQKMELIERVNPIMRKLAHYMLYIVGGCLATNYISTYQFSRKKVFIYSWSMGTIYAITDEIHQYFVPDRGAAFTDVLIDSAGVFTGVILFLISRKIALLLKMKISSSGT